MIAAVFLNPEKCGVCSCQNFFADPTKMFVCLCGHKINDHKVPIEVQIQAVKENAITQRLRENLIPREYVDISQSQDFVSSDRTSYAANCVLFLVFSTHPASASRPACARGDNFELEITAAGMDLYKQALRSTDSVHFEALLKSRSKKIVLPPIPDEDEKEKVLQSRWSACITRMNSFDEPLIKGRKLCDRHTTKSLFELKSDDVLYCGDDDAHVVLNELYILCLGDIKKPRTTIDEYTPDEYRQVVNYLILLLRK